MGVRAGVWGGVSVPRHAVPRGCGAGTARALIAASLSLADATWYIEEAQVNPDLARVNWHPKRLVSFADIYAYCDTSELTTICGLTDECELTLRRVGEHLFGVRVPKACAYKLPEQTATYWCNGLEHAVEATPVVDGNGDWIVDVDVSACKLNYGPPPGEPYIDIRWVTNINFIVGGVMAFGRHPSKFPAVGGGETDFCEVFDGVLDTPTLNVQVYPPYSGILPEVGSDLHDGGLMVSEGRFVVPPHDDVSIEAVWPRRFFYRPSSWEAFHDQVEDTYGDHCKAIASAYWMRNDADSCTSSRVCAKDEYWVERRRAITKLQSTAEEWTPLEGYESHRQASDGSDSSDSSSSVVIALALALVLTCLGMLVAAAVAVAATLRLRAARSASSSSHSSTKSRAPVVARSSRAGSRSAISRHA